MRLSYPAEDTETDNFNVYVGNLSREQLTDETTEQMSARLERALIDLFPYKIDAITVSVRGHAFLKCSADDAEAATGRTFHLDGRQLTVEARGDSEKHKLRSKLRDQLPPIQTTTEAAYWTLPDGVGGGL
eukprot:737581-Prymnesium_polylepis.1